MLSKRLRYLREKSGLTQGEIAKQLGIARTTYAGYENDARKPDVETLVQIADLLQVTIDYLVGRTAKPDQELSSDLERQFVDDIDSNLTDDEMLKRYGGKIDAENLPIPDDDLIQIVHFLRVKRMTHNENG